MVDEAVLDLLAHSNSRNRKELLRLCQQIAADPFQEGIVVEDAATGRPLQSKRFGKWQIKFWSDHGACEVRIVHAEEIDA